MKVMVVDDNAIVRLGLQSVLQRIEAVHEVIAADSAFSALEAHHAHSPDIILLDISMPPGRSGLEILPELARDASVIMLTSNRDPSSIREALDAGARGYLVHGQLGVNEVAGAIETCRSGGLVLGREAADVILNPSTEDLTDNPLRAQVSDREAEILDLAATGMSNSRIAQQLFLSERTVKNYLNSAYPKIQVHSRAEAIAVWLSPPPTHR
ncbi:MULTISPECIES: response regulator transcription factor [Actinomyces]|jgi:regulatory protein, luxR:response regulator receiver|uniref:Response regulator transcription factor n=1 Tax=Actinomyces viscosus TaxID=1656 RepID=A0ABT7TWP3_ACTVI|nr:MULTISPECIES: response regulator transcription factor [Actinomyces]MDM8076244.1 response regulator transcription factor [Actinomyces viscosus]MDR0181267.1 response regulator transcription factor [Actinomyces oris]